MKNTIQQKSAKLADRKISRLATMSAEQLKSLKGGASERTAGNVAVVVGFIGTDDLMCW